MTNRITSPGGWTTLTVPDWRDVLNNTFLRGKIQNLEDENALLREELAKLRVQADQQRSIVEPLVDYATHLSEKLAVAMNLVGEFVADHLDRFEKVLLTLGDGRFRFLLLQSHLAYECYIFPH